MNAHGINVQGHAITFEVNGAAGFGRRASGDAAVFRAARRAQAHRHQGRLRRRRLRRLHGAARRRAGLRVPRACGFGRRPFGADRRGPRQWQAVGAAGLLPRAWRGAMRHLHARPAGDGDGAAGKECAALRDRGQGCARRRALPLHRLSQDHRGGDGGVAARRRCLDKGICPHRARPSAHRRSGSTACRK